MLFCYFIYYRIAKRSCTIASERTICFYGNSKLLSIFDICHIRIIWMNFNLINCGYNLPYLTQCFKMVDIKITYTDCLYPATLIYLLHIFPCLFKPIGRPMDKIQVYIICLKFFKTFIKSLQSSSITCIFIPQLGSYK